MIDFFFFFPENHPDFELDRLYAFGSTEAESTGYLSPLPSPKEDKWTDQLLHWLYWISVAATTRLQPSQKGLATRGLGTAPNRRELLLGQGERKPLGEIAETVLEDIAVGDAYKIKKQILAVGMDQEKLALLNAMFLIGKGGPCCPISVLAKWS
ncbi:hypothetical protein llap_2956 [Limosa lapponica baueri]|uniref:Uncharacterized protein n=1 Tax=Limosa lapponica baueri TaxID=1758121 RepID=A0A2I0UL43_LIMLA|nr:hypothetical protein llap_2956 [Limosa lapponica baueri]